MVLYKDKRLLPIFVVKYITRFFLYGYLYLAGSLIFCFVLNHLFVAINPPYNYFSLTLILAIGFTFVRFCMILSTTRYKWRFYRLSYYRLQNKGYSEDYFKYEIFEPCTRLIVKDVLYQFNLQKEYKELKMKYLHVNQRIEDEKARLLNYVQRREINHIDGGV